MVVGTHVIVAGCRSSTGFTEDDDPGRAAVDAERAARANVVVDREHEGVRRVRPWLLSADRFGHGRRVDHVDALPRTDVDAAFTGNALGLVDVNELLRLDGLTQVVGVNLHQRVFVGERHHWRIGVSFGHY